MYSVWHAQAAQDLSRNGYTRNLLQAPAFSYGELDGYKKWDGECQDGGKVPQTPIDIPAKEVTAAAKMPAGDMKFGYSHFSGATALHKNGVQVPPLHLHSGGCFVCSLAIALFAL